jgi:hypothetical protein
MRCVVIWVSCVEEAESRTTAGLLCKCVQSITDHPLKQFSEIKLPDGKSNQELEKFCCQMHQHQHVFSHQLRSIDVQE